MNYLDTSALLKLVLDEEHADAMRTWWLREGVGASVTGRLTIAEIEQVLDRSGIARADAERVRELVGTAAAVPVDAAVDALVAAPREHAARGLRTLDALHLVGAELASARTVVTYDARLAAAATSCGLVAIAPGADA